MKSDDLEHFSNLIYKIIGQDNLHPNTDEKLVSQYYSDSSFFYRKFHSDEGAMHLPISFSKEDKHVKKLRFQADYVLEIINKHSYTDILELGCGMGFNARHLIEEKPDLNITGIDITEKNLEIAKQKNNNPHLKFELKSFDELENYSGKFDLIFAVETLCHSKDLSLLLKKATKLLNENGRIIIFDGYVKPDAPALSEAETKAYELFCWGFALEKFQNLKEVSEHPSLNIEELKEYSKNILPNYKAFEKGSIRALKFPKLLKFLLKIRLIPLTLIKQISAGLFGPHFVEKGYLGYFKIEISLK